jgi:hypothetical protein
MVLPSVNEAIRLGDESAVGKEMTDLAGRFDSATLVLQRATALIK